MRPGDVVWYAEEPGVVVQATVTAVVGRGVSLYKTLDLRTHAGREVRDVPNVRDCVVAAGYWCQNTDEVRVVTRETTEWVKEELVVPVSSKPRRRHRDVAAEDEVQDDVVGGGDA